MAPRGRKGWSSLPRRVSAARVLLPAGSFDVSLVISSQILGFRSPRRMGNEDGGEQLESVICLSSSDDEEANKDLSLEIVERAQQRKSKRQKGSDAEEAAERSSAVAAVINLSSSSSDELELVEGGAEPVMEEVVKKKKKRRSKKNKTKRKLEVDLEKEGEPSETATTAETEATVMFGNADKTEEFLMIDEVACVGPTGSSDNVIRATKLFEGVETVKKEANGVSDNAVLRKLLRGPRYFDPPDSHWVTCYNCGKEGHSVVNCTAQKRKKPCFVCGKFGHDSKRCTQGYKFCMRCGDSGHEMSSCGNDYVPDDLMAIQCYICKNFGHLCCANVDTGSREVCCYNCGQSGHVGTGCAKSNGETNAAVSPKLCYKCGEEGHFARGCSKSAKGAAWYYAYNVLVHVGGSFQPHHLGKPHKKNITFSDERNSMSSRRSKWRGGWVADHPGDLPGIHTTANGWDPWTPVKKTWKVSPLAAGGHCSTSRSPFRKKHKIFRGGPGSPFSKKHSQHKQFGRAYV
ncbi:hypothetical protein ACLOJK_005683 [Asimina triloba]